MYVRVLLTVLGRKEGSIQEAHDSERTPYNAKAKRRCRCGCGCGCGCGCKNSNPNSFSFCHETYRPKQGTKYWKWDNEIK